MWFNILHSGGVCEQTSCWSCNRRKCDCVFYFHIKWVLVTFRLRIENENACADEDFCCVCICVCDSEMWGGRWPARKGQSRRRSLIRYVQFLLMLYWYFLGHGLLATLNSEIFNFIQPTFRATCWTVAMLYMLFHFTIRMLVSSKYFKLYLWMCSGNLIWEPILNPGWAS